MNAKDWEPIPVLVLRAAISKSHRRRRRLCHVLTGTGCFVSELPVIREAKPPRVVNSGALSGPARREAISCPNDFPGNALIDRVTGIVYDNEVRCFPDAFEPPGVEER